MPAKTMLIRMTEAQHASVTSSARGAGLSLSQYVVARLLGAGKGAPAEALKAAETALEQSLSVLRQGVKTCAEVEVFDEEEEEVVLRAPAAKTTGYLTRSGTYIVGGAAPVPSSPQTVLPIPPGSTGVKEFIRERCSPEHGAVLQHVTGEDLVKEFQEWSATRSGVERLTSQQVKVKVAGMLGARSKVSRRGLHLERTYLIPLLRSGC